MGQAMVIEVARRLRLIGLVIEARIFAIPSCWECPRVVGKSQAPLRIAVEGGWMLLVV